MKLKKVTKPSSISIDHCRSIVVKTTNERQMRARKVDVFSFKASKFSKTVKYLFKM